MGRNSEDHTVGQSGLIEVVVLMVEDIIRVPIVRIPDSIGAGN
jgi:hypothetical protein